MLMTKKQVLQLGEFTSRMWKPCSTQNEREVLFLRACIEVLTDQSDFTQEFKEKLCKAIRANDLATATNLAALYIRYGRSSEYRKAHTVARLTKELLPRASKILAEARAHAEWLLAVERLHQRTLKMSANRISKLAA
ncbi:MAG: hypothetical protein NDI61_01900 [Bdellovibrionaceae bacterium]|nr:hypothetical protein [Pseudobdellovibrionaceae bacterium]